MLPNEACKRKTSSDYKSYKVNLCMVEKLLHDAHHGEFTISWIIDICKYFI